MIFLTKLGNSMLPHSSRNSAIVELRNPGGTKICSNSHGSHVLSPFVGTAHGVTVLCYVWVH